MGLFSKKAKIAVCEMCGKADVEGCGSAHKHVEQISGDQPVWLPGNLRAQAQGEYTWLCVRCNSYPAMKWPKDGGAEAGMMIHLGSAHYVGYMKGMGRTDFSMISANMLSTQEPDPEPKAAVWFPTVEMRSARPAVFTLAQAMAMNDSQVRAAIAELVRLSETPPLAHAQRMIGSEPDVLARPWKWLCAVMRNAQDSGDYALAAAGLLWALHWTALLVPKNDSNSFMELRLQPIPAPWKAEILKLGLAATSSLPDNFVVAGDETGQMLAGGLARLASDILGQ